MDNSTYAERLNPQLVIGRDDDLPPGAGAELEEEKVALRDPDGGDAPRIALCLSGGGIRSATFSLGVLQALAEIGWLKKFTYLSTVSGGGYIGSWLTTWIRRKGIDKVCADLAGGTNEREPLEIRQLRSGSNYLSPTTGFSGDTLALVATFVRNLLINWTVLIPLLIAATLIPMINVGIVDDVIHSPSRWASWQDTFFYGAIVAAVVGVGYVTSDLPGGTKHQTLRNYFMPVAFLPVLLGCYLLSLSLANNELIRTVTRMVHGLVTDEYRWVVYGSIGALVHLIAIGVGQYLIRPRRAVHKPLHPHEPPDDLGKLIPIPVKVFLIASASGFMVGWVVFEGVMFARAAQARFAVDVWSALYATFAVPFLLLCFALGTVLYVALLRRNSDEGAREWWGRSGGVWLTAAAVWVLVHGLCIWAPALLSRWSALATGGVGTLGGVLVAIAGYKSSHTPTTKQGANKSVLEILNVRVLDLIALGFVVVLFAFTGLEIISASADLTNKNDPGAVFNTFMSQVSAFPMERFCLAVAMLVFAWGFAWFAGVNAFSMHAMYGNRLARAYLGATRKPVQKPGTCTTDEARRPHAYTGFDPDDDVAVCDLGQEKPNNLFHVINIALNIVRASGNRLEWQERKAASFTVTPLRTGSRVTGFCKSESIGGRGATDVMCIDPDNQEKYARGITIGRAMTISGAAVSPSMGFHSSKLIAIVMAFFNVRLGWWLANPLRYFDLKQQQTKRLEEERKKLGAAADSKDQVDRRRMREAQEQEALVVKFMRTEPSNPLLFLISEMIGSVREDTKSVYLSDGGHFENLGLYEMVRRRCTQIVAVDAGCDPDHKFDDLERALRLIRNDLGVEIEFPHGLPTTEVIKRTGRHYTIGHITYPGGEQGRLLYIKPGLNGKEPLDVARYASRARENGEPFPHQSTSDQFFDEPQFESYRALGRHSLRSLVDVGRSSFGGIKPPMPRFDEVEGIIENAEAAAAEKLRAAAAQGETRCVVECCGDQGKKEAGGMFGALGSLLSWDKLPGLIATILGVSAGAATLATDKSGTESGAVQTSTQTTAPAASGAPTAPAPVAPEGG